MKSKTQNQDKATARPWHLQNETCIASGQKFVAQTMVDDEDSDLKSMAQAEADAALIVRAVNEHAALVAVAESAKAVAGMWTPTTSQEAKLCSALRNLAAVREGKAVQS